MHRKPLRELTRMITACILCSIFKLNPFEIQEKSLLNVHLAHRPLHDFRPIERRRGPKFFFTEHPNSGCSPITNRQNYLFRCPMESISRIKTLLRRYQMPQKGFFLRTSKLPLNTDSLTAPSPVLTGYSEVLCVIQPFHLPSSPIAEICLCVR